MIVEELIGIGKEYPMIKALDNISIKIRKKELMVIMGPSGSGKSTLLHMAGLLDAPTTGKILINGKKVPTSEDKRAELRSKFMGFIFQDFGLVSSLSALDNILMPTIFSKTEKTERALEIARALGIEKRLNHYPKQLSGGEKQRVSVARSLINNPQIIFADEPTGNLDSKTGDQVMRLLRELANKGKSIVVVSHNPEHTVYADRVVKVRDGKLI